MLSDRLHLNPRGTLLLWLLCCKIQIRGRGAEKWTDSINWMGPHQPIGTGATVEGCEGKGLRGCLLCGRGTGAKTFYISSFFLSFSPSLLPPLSLSLSPSCSYPSLDNRHARIFTRMHTYTQRQTHAHVHFTGALISCSSNNNDNSSYHVLRTFSLPALWSVLYNALSLLVLKSSLWGSFYRWGSW